MPYHARIITQKDQSTSVWSGGETTQLAIYPPRASFADRTFMWRLSTATVITPHATFTPLPGYNRLLMALEGLVTLKHHHHHTLTLKPHEVDFFSGAWETVSEGTCVDFNVIFREDVRASLSVITLNKTTHQVLALEEAKGDGDLTSLVIYPRHLGVVVAVDEKRILLKPSEVLLIQWSRPEPNPQVVLQNLQAQSVDVVWTQLHHSFERNEEMNEKK